MGLPAGDSGNTPIDSKDLERWMFASPPASANVQRRIRPIFAQNRLMARNCPYERRAEFHFRTMGYMESAFPHCCPYLTKVNPEAARF